MAAPPTMESRIGTHDLLLVTLDTLRYDVAQRLAAEGRLPTLSRLLPGGRWEERHSPGSFTYAAHAAFFAGFLPTPATPGKHARLFSMRFQGSETTAEGTAVFDAADLPSGLAGRGYHTICIGGVGFFNKQNPLGRVFPSLFAESHWSPEMGVTDPRSTENQVSLAARLLGGQPAEKRVFLFLNISALHQPNRHYLPAPAGIRSRAEALVEEASPGAERDSLESHAAALEYVDRSLPPLFDALRRRGPAFCILCSDHGTAYGEDGGFAGHRIGIPVVWTVPYAEFDL